jgi:hypothetical protein
MPTPTTIARIDHEARNPNGLTSGSSYGSLQRQLKKAGLPRAGVHIVRHSGA